MRLNRRELLSAGIGLAGGLAASSDLFGAVPAGPATSTVDKNPLRGLTSSAVASHATPGVALVVWKHGREVYSSYEGLANLETATPVAANSVFRIGSLTKQFTAALILKLVAEGRLSLDDKVQTHLPFLAQRDPFTMAELLHHTAGIHDSEQAPSGPLTQLELARALSGMEPFFDFPPGTAWRYSNAGYILAGAVIESVTGRPLADAAKSLLFEPLGLTRAAFDTVSEVVEGRVSGYTPSDGAAPAFTNADYLDVAMAGGAGAMRATAFDLCRWHHLLFQGDYLPKSLVQAMLTPGRLRGGALSSSRRDDPQAQAMGDVQYGYGFFLDAHTVDHHPVAGHHGGINGFAAYLASHPTSGVTYACLCNADTHPGLPLRDIRRRVLADVLA